MKNTLETRLGIFSALALIVAFIIMEMIGGFDLFKTGIRIHARFDTVQELKVGDPVKMAGVEIGKVDKIEFAADKVEVIMKITHSKAKVKTDSKASVRFAGLLGQNFVALTFGSLAAPEAIDGTELVSVEQPDFNTLMTQLDKVGAGIDRVAASFSTDTIKNLFGPITDFLTESRPQLTAIFGNMQAISSQISEGKGTVGKMIKDDTLYQAALNAVTNFNETANDIKGAISDAKAVIVGINEGRGTLGKLTRDETLYKESTTAMTNLREILQKMNQGQGSFGKLINDDSFLKNAKLSLQKLDKATEGLEDQGPLSILGIAVNSLF